MNIGEWSDGRMITVRAMQPQEAKMLKKVGWRAFGIVERLFVGTPKTAMVAVMDDRIVGGIIYKYIQSQDKKIGYFEEAFIDPDYQGKGIGKKLYQETTAYLWSQGCDALTALVKDDNVGSWQLFLNNGFSQTSMLEGVKQLGLLPMLKQYFTTPTCIGNGMEFYLAVKEKEVPFKKVQSITQIGLYLLINFLIMLLPVYVGKQYTLNFAAMYLALLAGGVGVGYIATWFSPYKWKFRLNSCGGALVACLSFGALYPLWGNWYPVKYENSESFRKAMGIQALCKWIGLIVVTLVALVLRKQNILMKNLYHIGSILLVLRCLNFYPFDFFGSRRIYLWHKSLFVLLSIVSIGIAML